MPRRSGLLAPERKLIVCAVRRPVHLEKPFGEAAYAYEPSRSGLSAAVESLEKSGVRCRWVAWPGCFVEKTSREGVRARLEDEFNCRPVFLDRDIEDLFYARFCHGVLWPLFHCIPATVGDKVGEKGGLVGTRATDQSCCRADTSPTNRSRGDSVETSRGDAAAATWIFRGDESRRGHSVETSRWTLREKTSGDAAAARWRYSVGARLRYEAYLSVNQQYLEALAAEYLRRADIPQTGCDADSPRWGGTPRPGRGGSVATGARLRYQEGDLVVVHDYELMLLPAMIRSRFPEAACGFFCNCPFPSSEFYRMLPARDALLRGVLGADLISFNHFDYVRHFLNACMRVLGLESAPSRLEHVHRADMPPTTRGDAAAATWISSRRRLAATPRPRRG